MHEKYGPIVRISPDELHVYDSAFIDELYAGGGKRRDKSTFYTWQFGTPGSILSTASHDLHRLRRSALNPFFSKASVVKLEPIIVDTVQKLCRKIEMHAGSGTPITISSAFFGMTTDIISEYAFAKSTDFLETDNPKFEINLHRAITSGAEMGVFMKYAPWLYRILQALPDSVIARMNPMMKSYLIFQREIRDQIVGIMRDADRKSGRSSRTIFHELLAGDLPEKERRLIVFGMKVKSS
ncbi:hypothetical protein FQN49_006745 [Arthroderma sp. PD_2]|nr:hypothetical protein FQN49_006745 [Arthroderma sp. PD_2]